MKSTDWAFGGDRDVFDRLESLGDITPLRRKEVEESEKVLARSMSGLANRIAPIELRGLSLREIRERLGVCDEDARELYESQTNSRIGQRFRALRMKGDSDGSD